MTRPRSTSPPPARAGVLLLTALMLGAALPTAGIAAEPPVEAPRFFIERIRVEGVKRASPQIIVSESFLVEGKSYDEAEIRLGVHRIHRLPFVLDVEVALRKGSERGKYELLFTVKEAKRFFFGADLAAFRFTEPLSFENAFLDEGAVQVSTTAGIRQFIGSYGMAFAAVGAGQGVQVGYTHYRLFGKPALLSLAYSRASCCPSSVFPLGLDPTFSEWSAGDSQSVALTVGVPIRHDRSIRGSLSLIRGADGSRTRVLGGGFLDFLENDDLREERLELTWVQDTTDDGLFPTAGTLLTAGLDYRSLEAEQTFFDFAPPVGFEEVELPTLRSELLRLVASGSWHHTPPGRSTFTLSARAAVGRASIESLPLDGVVLPSQDVDVLEASLGLRHSFSLWRPAKVRRSGDFRWETSIEYGFEDTSFEAPPPGEALGDPLGQLRIGTSLVFRNGWGVFRLGFVFLDVERL